MPPNVAGKPMNTCSRELEYKQASLGRKHRFGSEIFLVHSSNGFQDFEKPENLSVFSIWHRQQVAGLVI